MLLQTAKVRRAAALTQYDNEYAGNTTRGHYAGPTEPSVYYNDGDYVADGTIGAAQYTIDAVRYSGDSASGTLYNDGVLWADVAYPGLNEPMLLLIETGTWTRLDGGTIREFFLGHDDFGNGVLDRRYYSPSGVPRNSTASDYFGADSGPDSYTVSDIGITPNGVLLIFFEMTNPDATFRNLVFGPMYPGSVRFGLAKL